MNGGVKAEAYAKALIEESVGLRPQARFRLNQTAAGIRARALDRACRTQFTTLGATSAQINAVINAGATLQTSLRNTTNDSDLTAAFDDSAIAMVQATLSGATRAEVTAITEVLILMNMSV